VSAEARQQWLWIDIHFAEDTRNLDQNADALERWPVVELRQS
jgi:hypothetical protein